MVVANDEGLGYTTRIKMPAAMLAHPLALRLSKNRSMSDSNKTHRAFRYRIYPTIEQQVALAIQFGHARFVYNWGLAKRKQHYQQHGKGISFYELKRQLTKLKHTPEFEWLREADSQVLQAKLEDLDRAYQNFFEKRARYPQFKARKHEQKIRYPQRFKLEGNRIYLPKVGWVKIVLRRAIGRYTEKRYRDENQVWELLRVHPV
jgi:transposase